ncbi:MULTISPECIES: trigger factor [unclassified Enterococcus]|uniref:trigger factor n=1 Tax=unclassified Enterococcus TaxID=2608891 RepID=UPI0015539032|nr:MULTISPECIES: trigger factor [unclassified Enterococcus]MBS7576241.1 trigger factor [Enterococcus sp. MMGLQ5-2]MBS7583474.1 trigger factor [Enterococcus sp. MMGLQ5-1]NPD11334.1 trigger factor [Enterococcus sp. MMGLQ5-1]NPD36077.1 trigger factor [Enterococcus sp. MMGLQ5-2]
MSVNFEKQGTNDGVLTFSIDQATIQEGLTKTFNKAKKNLNVPGFRKGKVSRSVFNRMYGEEALYEDTLNAILPDVYEAAVKAAELDVVAQPKIDIESMNKGEDWVIKATVVTKPEVKLGEYKNLAVEVPSEEVTDEDIDAKLKVEQSKLAEFVIKEDTAAEDGDVVVIDFAGSVDGVEFEGGKAENHSLELGSGSFIPGFEAQLVGHKAGETLNVEVTFPEEYQAADLAGKDAVFVTTIHEVKAKETPELDDEFAKDVDDEVETLVELKEKFKAELTEQKATAAQEAKEEAAIQAAVGNAEVVDLPEEMVHEEVHRSMNEFFGNLQRQGIDPQTYYQITGTSEQDLHDQYAKDAETRVKTNLVIEAIAKTEDFEVNDSEIEEELKSLSEQYNIPVEQIKTMLSTDMLKHDILMKKAVEAITETAVAK